MSKTRLIAMLVENKPGVLQRISGLVRRKGFNIESLSVGPTLDPTLSRMTIAIHAGSQETEQVAKQLNKLIDVVKVSDITDEEVISREMMIVKLSVSSGKRDELKATLDLVGGRILYVGRNHVVAELTGDGDHLDDVIEVIKPYGIKELARSGAIAMVREAKTL
jgi:acetolactate synthase-1/3 small subunit